MSKAGKKMIAGAKDALAIVRGEADPKTYRIRYPVTRSSGNVFADIGMKNPKQHLAKAEIAMSIGKLAEAQGLMPAQAAARIGVGTAKFNAIMRGVFSDIPLSTMQQYERAMRKRRVAKAISR